MRVTDSWLIYILVVLAIYLMLSFCNCRLDWSVWSRLLAAFLGGLLVTLFLIPSIQPENDTDRTLYSLLLIIGFLVPLGLALWLAWSKKMIPGLEGFDQVFECQGDTCQLVQEVKNDASGRRSKYLYRD